MLVLCCKFTRIARNVFVHFITQQKLTNHYNENSTIKAKPLTFSGLDSFFTFFKPRHPISVKKLRANRRFHRRNPNEFFYINFQTLRYLY